MNQDLLTGDNGDLLIQNGDFVIGDGTYQEVASLLGTNPGDVRHAPVLGPGLIRYVKGKLNQEQVESVVSQHLKLDGKDFKKIKEAIKFK